MNFWDRLKIAVMPENNLMSILQKYANDFLAGEDMPASSYNAIDAQTALTYSAVFSCNRVLSETLAIW